MHAQELKVDTAPLQFRDCGGCSIGWMQGFPYDAYKYGDSNVSPEAFTKAESIGGTYTGMHYRRAWLASIKIPDQAGVREALKAAGYALIATSEAAHDSKAKMELWGKGFTVQAEKPVEKIRARAVKLLRHPHRRAAQAA